MGSLLLASLCHSCLSHAWCSSRFLSNISTFSLSFHRYFGRPLLLCPGTSISITLLPTEFPSLHITCPYHFILLPSIFKLILAIFTVSFINSFLILSFFVTPHIQHNILISAIVIYFSCAFFIPPRSATVHHSWTHSSFVHLPCKPHIQFLVAEHA